MSVLTFPSLPLHCQQAGEVQRESAPLVGLEEARYRQIYRRVRKHFQSLQRPDITHRWLKTNISVRIRCVPPPDGGIDESFQGAMTVSKRALTVSPCRRGSHQHSAPAGAGRSIRTSLGECPCSIVRGGVEIVTTAPRLRFAPSGLRVQSRGTRSADESRSDDSGAPPQWRPPPPDCASLHPGYDCGVAAPVARTSRAATTPGTPAATAPLNRPRTAPAGTGHHACGTPASPNTRVRPAS